MTSGAFNRAAARLLAHFGQEAVLRGADTITVILTHNAEIIGEYGQVTELVTVASLHPGHHPRIGDTLQIGPQHYTLDRHLKTAPNLADYILRPSAPPPAP